MKVRIDIDTKTFIRFILVVIGFGLLLFALYSARTALLIVGISFFLAVALNIPVSLLANKLPGRSRIGATALSYVAIIALLGAVITLVIPPIVQQTAQFVERVPSFVEDAGEQWSGIGDLIDQYNLQGQVDSALASIQENASTWAADFGSGLVSSIGSVFAFMVGALLVLVITFLMLVEGPAWLKRLWKIYTDQDKLEQHKRMTDKMYHVVTGYVTGQITVSAIGAACSALFVFGLSFFFDVPANLAMPTAAITFVFSLIPMFGATIAGVLVSLLLAINALPAGIIFAVFFIIYQQIENNMISPHIQSKKIDLSALAVLVAATIGTYVAGILGGIISIPIAGCIRVLLDEYFESAKKKRKRSRQPLSRLVKKIKGDEA